MQPHLSVCMSLNIIQPPKRNIQAVCDNAYGGNSPPAGRAIQVGGSSWGLHTHLIKIQLHQSPGSGEAMAQKRAEAP